MFYRKLYLGISCDPSPTPPSKPMHIHTKESENKRIRCLLLIEDKCVNGYM